MKQFVILTLFFLMACSGETDPKILFSQGEYEKAYERWLSMAEQDDLEAQNYMGIHHYLGLGIKRNLKKANQWFEKAATAGFSDAQYNLGLMYENGHYVQQDYVKAFIWFYIASEKGNENAGKRMQAINDEYKLLPFQIWNAMAKAKAYLQDIDDVTSEPPGS